MVKDKMNLPKIPAKLTPATAAKIRLKASKVFGK